MSSRGQKGPLTCRLCPNEWITFTKYNSFRAHMRVHHQMGVFDKKELPLYQTYPGSLALVEYDLPRAARPQERSQDAASNRSVTQVDALGSSQLNVGAIEQSIAAGKWKIYLVSTYDNDQRLTLCFTGLERGIGAILQTLQGFMASQNVQVLPHSSSHTIAAASGITVPIEQSTQKSDQKPANINANEPASSSSRGDNSTVVTAEKAGMRLTDMELQLLAGGSTTIYIR